MTQLDIQTIQTAHRDLVVSVPTGNGREVVNVTLDYYPDRLTQDEFDDIGYEVNTGVARNINAAWDMFSGFVDGWDILAGGEPLPFTRESFGSLPPVLSGYLVDAVMGDFKERSELNTQGKASRSTS